MKNPIFTRIGRTGRAGRKGKALLLVTPREKRLLKDIERAIESQIDRVAAPSVDDMSRQRVRSLSGAVKGVIGKSKKLALYKELVTELVEEEKLPVDEVAAALAYMLHQSNPLPTEEISAVDWDSAPPKRRRGNRRGDPRRHPAERRAANRERKPMGQLDRHRGVKEKNQKIRHGKRRWCFFVVYQLIEPLGLRELILKVACFSWGANI